MDKNKSLFFPLCLCLLFCCTPPATKKIDFIAAAYYWKTQFVWTEAAVQKSQKIGLKKLYIRYFDIKLDEKNQAYPNAINQNGCQGLSADIEAIPVVFILNSVFKNQQDSAAVETLAAKTVKLIQNLHKGRILKEVQIDCDWTAGTSQAYFIFLQAVKKQLPSARISCTLRLWQFKDRSTSGVPPTDRVMLMAYNLQNASDWSVENSILERSEAAKYLENQSPYPLPMDLALPHFYWAVLFRSGNFEEFLEKTTVKNLEQAGFFEKIAPNRYRCLADTFWHARYFLKEDKIRTEAVSEQTLQEVTAMAQGYLNEKDSACLSYFEF